MNDKRKSKHIETKSKSGKAVNEKIDGGNNIIAI
jgi:hypothetical protein